MGLVQVGWFRVGWTKALQPSQCLANEGFGAASPETLSWWPWYNNRAVATKSPKPRPKPKPKPRTPVPPPTRPTGTTVAISPGVEILTGPDTFPVVSGEVEQDQSDQSDQSDQPEGDDPYAPPPMDAPESYPGHPKADPVKAIAFTPSNHTPEGRLARRTQAMEMRIRGLSYNEIAARLGISVATAYYDVQRSLVSLGKYNTHLTEQVREVELARLDLATQALMPGVVEGKLGPIEVMLKVMARRAALLGLDADTAKAKGNLPDPQQPLTVLRNMSQDQIEARLAVLRQRTRSARRLAPSEADRIANGRPKPWDPGFGDDQGGGQ